MLKVISLNLQRSKHLSYNLPFLRTEKPDVLCAQEAFEADLDRIKEETGMPFSIWLPDVLNNSPSNTTGEAGLSGPAIFSRTPFLHSKSQYYYVPEEGISLEAKDNRPFRETNAQVFLCVTVEKDGMPYAIANTHFTWTADGYPDETQEKDFLALKEILETLGPHVLTGDFNAPRGRGIWEKFVSFYGKDNIPPDISSTIDPELHRRKDLTLVVDGIFTQLPYFAENVQVIAGLSDHQAIVAEVGQY